MVFCLPPTASCFLSCLKTAELRMQAKQFYLGLGRRFPLLLLIKAYWEWIQLWRGGGVENKNYFSSCCREPGQTLTSHSVLLYVWAPFPVPTSAHHLLLQNGLEWQVTNDPGDLLAKVKSSRFPKGVIDLSIVSQSFLLGSGLSPVNGCSSHSPTNPCSKPNPCPMASHMGFGDNMIDFPAILGTRIIGHISSNKK